MATNDQYALNWSHHTSHIRKAFDKLFQRDEFVDVTISCQGKKIKAHRMILSACSSYFHDLLRDNPCPHPIIILRDTEYENIERIIQFMYNGEVQVATENFSSFLKTAELLEVCGLTGDSQDQDFSQTVPSTPKSEIATESVARERSRPAPASKKLERKRAAENAKRPSIDDAVQHKKKKEKAEVKEELPKVFDNVDDNEDSQMDEELSLIEEAALLEPMTTQKMSHVQELLIDESYLSKEANPEYRAEEDERADTEDPLSLGCDTTENWILYQCEVCGKRYQRRDSLYKHLNVHKGTTKCSICSKVLSRKSHLERHMYVKHSEHMFARHGEKVC